MIGPLDFPFFTVERNDTIVIVSNIAHVFIRSDRRSDIGIGWDFVNEFACVAIDDVDRSITAANEDINCPSDVAIIKMPSAMAGDAMTGAPVSYAQYSVPSCRLIA